MGDLIPLKKREARVHEFVGLLFCDTRRAKQWQRALTAAGIESRVLETFGEEETAGAYKVSVPRSDLPVANELVTAVTRGDRRLPGTGLSWTSVIAIVVVVAMLAAVIRGAF
jgi:hypothetical protein